ncbi:unnamed protein product [Heterobilharzia americana]|nr:unnamed protein product [Heterobilharzia americana]
MMRSLSSRSLRSAKTVFKKAFLSPREHMSLGGDSRELTGFFNPEAHGLRSCKVPQAELKKMLEALNQPQPCSSAGQKPLLALELDCCVIPLRNNLKLIQTTDFFYPLIDDPYTMAELPVVMS